jgi:hypothetical protein
MKLLQNQRIRLLIGAVIMLLVGFLGAYINAGGMTGTSASDFNVAFGYSDVSRGLTSIPLLAVDAEKAGWKGSIRCHQAQGRFYRKLSGEDPDPVMLLYDQDGNLIGLNMHSPIPQPGPWSHMPEGLLGVKGRQNPYWDINMFFGTPTHACETRTGGLDFVQHKSY